METRKANHQAATVFIALTGDHPELQGQPPQLAADLQAAIGLGQWLPLVSRPGRFDQILQYPQQPSLQALTQCKAPQVGVQVHPRPLRRDGKPRRAIVAATASRDMGIDAGSDVSLAEVMPHSRQHPGRCCRVERNTGLDRGMTETVPSAWLTRVKPGDPRPMA